MDNNFPTYCLNLARREKRRQFAENQISNAVKHYQIIDAIDYQSPDFKHLLSSVDLKFHPLLSDAEKAEFCSHYLRWEAVASGDHKLALIVEDDVCFVENIAKILSSFDFSTLENLEAIAIIGFLDPFTATLKAVDVDVTYYRARLPASCHAYFITKEGARKLTLLCKKKEVIKYPMNMQIFTFIEEMSILQFSKCLAHQNFALEGDIKPSSERSTYLAVFRKCGFPY